MDIKESVLGRLEPLLKIASLIGIGLYVMGLLVFNIFLAKYGITDFAALKPQCLFTGAWAFLLLVIAASPVFGFDFIASSVRTSGWRRWSLALGVAIGLMFPATIMLNGLYTSMLGGPDDPITDFLLLDSGVPGWRPLLFSVTSVGIITSIFKRVFFRDDDPQHWYIESATSLIVPCLGGLFIIGNYICQQVNPEVGGGKPLNAVLYFSAEGQQLLQFMRSNTSPFHDGEPDNVIKGALIYATSDRYVFLIASCRHREGTPWRAENLSIYYTAVVADKRPVQAVFLSGEPLYGSGSPCPYAEEMIKHHPPPRDGIARH